jgi:hypothetical protein
LIPTASSYGLLLIKERRTNVFSVATIVVVKDRWVSKTKISPNK